MKGDLVDVSKVLANTYFAYYDEKVFLHELTTFQLKTHLDRYKTAGVIEALEKCYPKTGNDKLEALKAVTSIARAEQDFEQQLTSNNPRDGLKVLPLTPENIRLTLERKQRDFQQCKDIDEISIGRGHSPNSTALESKRPGIKTTNLAPTEPETCNQHAVKHFQNTKQMLLSLAKHKATRTQVAPGTIPDKSDRINYISLEKNATAGCSVQEPHVSPVHEASEIELNAIETSPITTERPYQTVGDTEREVKQNKKLLNTASQAIRKAEMCEETLKNRNRAALFVDDINSSRGVGTCYEEANSFEEDFDPVQVRKRSSEFS